MENAPKHQSGQIMNNFKLISHLGIGGFGEVWMAEHTELLGKKEVIKFVKDKKSLEILKEEGTVMHELNHPSIVRVTDMNTVAEFPYLRMEYVEGDTLEHLLQKEHKISWVKSLEICFQIANILEFAHEQHIYHGDIKPSNIFYHNDLVKLTDFGLGTYYLRNKNALEFSGCLKGAEVKTAGTLNYMSPEQKQGKINPKTDIYSLGVVLYRLITGNLPSGLEAPSHFVKCPEEVDRLVTKMLAPLDKRYRNMADVQKDIREILAVHYRQPSYLWEMFCFILGVCLIVFAIGFLYRIPIALATVCIVGFSFLEVAREKLPQFWPLLFFWIGIGAGIVGFINRLYILIPIPLTVGFIGGVWFLLSPENTSNVEANSKEDQSNNAKKSSR